MRLTLLACFLRRRICSRLLARGGAPLGSRVRGGKEGGRDSLLLVFDRLVVAPARPARPFFRRRSRGFPPPARVLDTLLRALSEGISRLTTFAARSSHGLGSRSLSSSLFAGLVLRSLLLWCPSATRLPIRLRTRRVHLFENAAPSGSHDRLRIPSQALASLSCRVLRKRQTRGTSSALT